jgi:hypothetical protein
MADDSGDNSFEREGSLGSLFGSPDPEEPELAEHTQIHVQTWQQLPARASIRQATPTSNEAGTEKVSEAGLFLIDQ